MHTVLLFPCSTKLKGCILVSPCLSVHPSVCTMVSTLYLPQYSPDPFHIYTSYQVALGGVSCCKVFFQNWNICNFDFFLSWLGIQYESMVWVIMGWWGWVGWVGVGGGGGGGYPQNAGVLVVPCFVVVIIFQFVGDLCYLSSFILHDKGITDNNQKTARPNHVYNSWDVLLLTHWGRVTHICVSKLTIIASDNGLVPGWRQAIIWTKAGILLIGPPGTNFSEILIEIHIISFNKIQLKTSSGKWQPSCLGLNVLKNEVLTVYIDLASVSVWLNK